MNHHEQTPKVQQVFLERVNKLFQVFTDMGNPLKENRAGGYFRLTQTTLSIPVQVSKLYETIKKT